MKLLIIDDDPIVLLLAGAVLGAEGYQIVTAESGSEGLAKVRSEKPDLILLDLYLLDTDGLALLDTFKQDGRLRQIPVVFLTGESKRHHLDEMLVRGARAVIRKPFKSGALVRQLKEILETIPAGH